MNKKLWIKQVRGAAGKNKNQRLILKGLGLKHCGNEKEVPDSPSIRGMINKISHLVICRIVQNNDSNEKGNSI